MDILFFSRDNFNLLHQIIDNKIKEQHEYEVENRHNKDIINVMKYVYSKVNPKPPSNMTKTKYLDLMNIKCLSMILPQIEEKINTQRDLTKIEENNMQSDKHITSQSSSQITMRNPYGIEYSPDKVPKPEVISNNGNDIENKLEELKFTRNTFEQENPTPNQKLDQDVRSDKNIPNQNMNSSREHVDSVTHTPNQNMNSLDLTGKHDNSDTYINSGYRKNLMDKKEMPPSSEQTLNLYNKRLEERGISALNILQKHQQINNNNLQDQNYNQQITKQNQEIHERFGPMQNNEERISEENEWNVSPLLYDKNGINNRNNPNDINTISPVILPPKPAYIKKYHFVTIDSRDRDLSLYPNPSFFQVKFAPASDNIITNTINVKTGSVEIKYIIRQDVIGDRGASITREFDNILYIQCLQALVPKDNIYVCGICPNRYYNNSIDVTCDQENKQIPTKENSNRAIWNNRIGIETTVLDEPYLYLNISELESYSPYGATNTTGRNAFAKLVYESNFGILSSYIKMQTSDIDEFYRYSPTALGKIDKFTLSLLRPQGDLFDFGKDKLFVLRFEESDFLLKNCENSPATRVVISQTKSFCNCDIKCNCDNPVNSHCLKPGDQIFFYSTKPCKPSFILFHDPYNQMSYNNFRLIINDDQMSNSLNISIAIIVDEMTDTEELIDFSTFVGIHDYLVLRLDLGGNFCNEFFKVIYIDCTNIIIEKNNDIELMDNIIINKIGYALKNKKGIQSDNKNDIISKFGIRVCNVGDSTLDCNTYDPNDGNSGIPGEELVFDIDIPFDSLPSFCLENYKDCEIFFIKQKLQISYTFKIVTLEKDYCQLESLLVGP